MTDISAQLIAQVRRDLEELESSAVNGLAHPGDQGVSAALDRLEAAMDELRALVA